MAGGHQWLLALCLLSTNGTAADWEGVCIHIPLLYATAMYSPCMHELQHLGVHVKWWGVLPPAVFEDMQPC
jgi:hypothetical protein